MGKVQNVCFITPRYPTETNPAHTFIDQLICEIADSEISCNVISPYSITNGIIHKKELLPKIRERLTTQGNKITIYSPRYISLSHCVLGIKTHMFTYRNYFNTVIKEYNRRNLKADVLYGHFVFPHGLCAADLGNKLGLPAFLAYGESSITMYTHIGKSVLKNRFNNLSGVIAVSSENKRELCSTGIINNNIPIGVFPNATNTNKFFRINKSDARKQLGFSLDKFVVVFVGHFIERKGVTVLSNALSQLDDVYSVFIGNGPLEPKCKNIIFKGRVPNEKLYLYLNAADVFVLPTLAEGCCNAIIEAMACGLPIISSDRPFNDDILNDENSIRIEPENIEQIKNAIIKVRDNLKLRESMSQASLKMAKKLDIRQRAANILEFMNSRAGY